MKRISKRTEKQLNKIALLITEAHQLAGSCRSRYSPEGEMGGLLQELQNRIELVADALDELGFIA